MGAVTEHRKRGRLDIALPRPMYDFSASFNPLSKKPKFVDPSSSTPSRSLPPLPRSVHAPQRILKAFGLGAARNSLVSGKDRTSVMGNQVSRLLKQFKSALSSSRGSERRETNVSVGTKDCLPKSICGNESDSRIVTRVRGNVSDILVVNRSKVEKIKAQNKHWAFVMAHYASHLFLKVKAALCTFWHFFKKKRKISGCWNDTLPKVSICPGVCGLRIATQPTTYAPGLRVVDRRKVEDARRVAVDSLPKPLEIKVTLDEHLYEEPEKHDDNLNTLEPDVKLNEEQISEVRKEYEEVVEEPKEDLHALFSPLSDEEMREVYDALYGGSSHRILVTHKQSNIEITEKIFQCLREGGWLNDEVINLYLALLKERELREAGRFLKCHFFNTFFYKKLTSGRKGYDYEAVRRWTTQKKLGYGLIECDKIFVPIHRGTHWCLAVINVKNMTVQYLDSLRGMDREVLSILAKYLMDEAKDKSDKEIDMTSWTSESVNNLPLQKNGYDCGMFMLKYIDFYSRGLPLHFSQENMAYFRMRTGKEILRLRAE